MMRTLVTASSLRSALPHVVFGLLVILNVVRTLRHAMWRDEFQAFMIAAESSNVLELFEYLKYEQHPGLWHALLWVVTRFTTDPISMQLLHIGIAVGIWLLVYLYSPFSTVEKFLLILSYFLFWEYFVISRNYALAALLGFGFVAWRTCRSQSELLPWILLGLLANTVVYGTIWSMALAAVFVVERGRLSARFVGGIGIYLLCLSIAVASMMVPVSDHGFYYGSNDSLFQSLYQKLVHFEAVRSVIAGAFLPIRPTWLLDWCAYFADPGSAQPPAHASGPDASPIPRFWNPNFATEHPLRLAILLPFPIAICWLLVRSPIYVIEFILVYLGVLLFTILSQFTGYARHHGILFLALVACLWRTRRYAPSFGKGLFFWYAILIVSATSGIATLSSELHPFSNGRNVAAWLKSHNLEDQFIIGNEVALTIAGYLGRPIYQLECECEGTLIDNFKKREHVHSVSDLIDRVDRAIDKSAGREVLLILVDDNEVNQAFISAYPGTTSSRLRLTLARVFGGAVAGGENYYIYRATRMSD